MGLAQETSQRVVVLHDSLLETLVANKKPVLDIGCGNHPNQEADIIADAHHLPLRSEAFSKITMYEVIEHLNSPKQALAELRRILEPKGTLELSTPNTMFIGDYSHWFVNPDRKVSSEHIWGWRLPELRNLLTQSKFEIASFSFMDHERFWRPARLARIFLLSRLVKHHVLVQASKKWAIISFSLIPSLSFNNAEPEHPLSAHCIWAARNGGANG
jgi:SAM-dependent methyltransferase